MQLNIRDTFNKELPADPVLENTRRQVYKACFSFVSPKSTSRPQMIHVSSDMLENLRLSVNDGRSTEFLEVFTGNAVLPKTRPYAMCYGGHQFGNWAGQLGDGRAINLGEVIHRGERWALQIKGAGETPYSRTADGLAVLRSSIREYLCSEAMHHLGVPTTRAVSLALSGDRVLRDILYNGNPDYEKGAIVCRAAPTFLRFGNFEILSARQDIKTLRILVDYTLKHFYPHLGVPSKETYVEFFKEVADRTLKMIVHWQRVGFVHGVMNTDNMSILGLTIDYGPYGWLEGYDPSWTPNTTDRQNKRYRYGNQPNIGLWNLYQLANALYPLIESTEPLEAILERYRTDFKEHYLEMMKGKLGLFTYEDNDNELVSALEENLQLTETDMTIFFRHLGDFNKNRPGEGFTLVLDAFYAPEKLTAEIQRKWANWFIKYAERLQRENLPDPDRKAKMNTLNPKYVLRNYMAQLAIDAADIGDYTVIDELYQLLKQPYAEQKEAEKWFAKRPEWARHKVGCSMLSCSS